MSVLEGSAPDATQQAQRLLTAASVGDHDRRVNYRDFLQRHPYEARRLGLDEAPSMLRRQRFIGRCFSFTSVGAAPPFRTVGVGEATVESGELGVVAEPRPDRALPRHLHPQVRARERVDVIDHGRLVAVGGVRV